MFKNMRRRVSRAYAHSWQARLGLILLADAFGLSGIYILLQVIPNSFAGGIFLAAWVLLVAAFFAVLATGPLEDVSLWQ